MKRLKNLLGAFQTSPIWLRVCLAVPFVTAAVALFIVSGQSKAHAFLPAGDTSAIRKEIATTEANPAENRPSETREASTPPAVAGDGAVVVHGSLSGNPRHIDDPQWIFAPQ